MPNWPEALPQSPLLDGARETPADTVIRTAMETGPAKTRRRTTAGTGRLSLTYILSRAELTVLEGFFSTDLFGGALSFAFPHPRLGETVDCRFRQPPAFAPINGDFFRVGLELEVLP